MSHEQVRRTVLFVDDDVDLTRAIALALRKERFRTVTASSAAAALQVLATEKVDVIVSDDQMPGGSGAELLARVRAEHPGIVRILLSGQTDVRRAAHVVNEAGVFRFLVKPYDRDVLAATLTAAFASSEPTPAPDQADTTRRFEAALGELWLAQQPIYDRSGAIVGFELLLRSSSAEFRGPENLLAMARLLDRSVELDRSVADSARFAAAALSDLLIFVNVDPGSLRRDELFLPLVPHAHHIVLEITEREALGEPKQMASRIHSLKQRGFRVAVDDLGSGHSGLNAVVDLAPDIVKLDMGLIRDADRSYVKQRLVRSVCDASRDLGIRVVAEGIESLAELDTTLDAGCDYFQGYLLGRPGRDAVTTKWPRPPEPEALAPGAARAPVKTV